MERGYKNSKYENLAKENREIVRDFGYPYNLDRENPHLIKFKENEKILGTYLEKNYPNNFNYVEYRFDIIEPYMNFNIDEEEIDLNTQSLEDSSAEISDIWNRVTKERGYKPKLHDIIKIYFLNIQHRYYGGLVFFIDDSGIYVTRGYFYAPDIFYNFLEGLGLGEDFNKYIYRNSYASFSSNRWPYRVTLKERL